MLVGASHISIQWCIMLVTVQLVNCLCQQFPGLTVTDLYSKLGSRSCCCSAENCPVVLSQLMVWVHEGQGNGENPILFKRVFVCFTPYVQLWKQCPLLGSSPNIFVASVSSFCSSFFAHSQADMQRAPAPEKHSRFHCYDFVPSSISHNAPRSL